jgi:hypothetical protein
MKPFLSMTHEEKLSYIATLRNYLNDSIPQMQSQFSTEVFKQGLELISAYSRTSSFLEEREIFHDYRAQLPSLVRWVETIIRESEQYVQLHAPQPDPNLTPHVGRPTTEEKKAREQARAKQQEKMAQIAPKVIEAPEPTTVLDVVALSGTLPTLRQIAWLMPQGIATRIDSLRDDRTAFADYSEQAKRLGAEGKETEAAEAAREAQKLLVQIKGLYADVDYELAVIHIRLKDDPNYRKEKEEQWKKIDEIISFTKPYYQKVSEDTPTFVGEMQRIIAENSPEAIAERERKAEEKREADAIIKYLTRTDKPNTLKRIATMQERVKRLREIIGDEAEPYEQKVKIDAERPVMRKKREA